MHTDPTMPPLSIGGYPASVTGCRLGRVYPYSSRHLVTRVLLGSVTPVYLCLNVSHIPDWVHASSFCPQPNTPVLKASNPKKGTHKSQTAPIISVLSPVDRCYLLSQLVGTLSQAKGDMKQTHKPHKDTHTHTCDNCKLNSLPTKMSQDIIY